MSFKKITIALFGATAFILVMIYFLVPFLDSYSFTWREIRLKSCSINSFIDVVTNIDRKSRQIDARSEGLAQCYNKVEKNKYLFIKNYHMQTMQKKKAFKKCLYLAYDGYRDTKSLGDVSEIEFHGVIKHFRE